MFCFNYPDCREIIKWICERTKRKWLEQHLNDKFTRLYEVYGAHAVMQVFYTELDHELRDALVDYCFEVYAGQQ